MPVVSHRCRQGCCTRFHLPLTLACARTIHKFQGLSAGPVDPGKPPNACERMLCDPDSKKRESRCIGLLCTALSRATTLGDESGLGSAIHFVGTDFKADRIRCLCNKQDSADKCEIAQKRDRWVSFLQSKTTMRPQRIQSDPSEWSLTHRLHDLSQLQRRIATHTGRSSAWSRKRMRDE